jgi:hypothetical protein
LPVAECCGPKRPVAPPTERTVTGTTHWPPDMNRNFGSSLTMASAAVGRKSLNMISTTGRSPVTAMPSATPMKPFSQIGVLRIRSRPNFSASPSFVLKTPPAVATSSPIRRTVGSSSSSCSSAAPIASR